MGRIASPHRTFRCNVKFQESKPYNLGVCSNSPPTKLSFLLQAPKGKLVSRFKVSLREHYLPPTIGHWSALDLCPSASQWNGAATSKAKHRCPGMDHLPVPCLHPGQVPPAPSQGTSSLPGSLWVWPQPACLQLGQTPELILLSLKRVWSGFWSPPLLEEQVERQ